MSSSSSQFSRYRAVVSHLAQTCLATASKNVSRTPAERAGSLTVALPAAAALLPGTSEASQREAIRDLPGVFDALANGPIRLLTLTQQSRPVYFPLAVHLALRAAWVHRDTLDRAVLERVRERPRTLATILAADDEPEATATVLWRCLCGVEAAALTDDEATGDAAVAHVERVLAESPEDGALHGRTMDDQLDHWTYRELSGLHALTNLALHTGRKGWWAAVERVARFHLGHTQPDYTTYEPWAVHAFLHWPTEMAVFAEQQLHDTQTNLHVSGDAAALLPALLLADAAGALQTL